MPQYSGVFTLSQVAQAIQERNWTNLPPENLEYLVVAGGGSGGGDRGGGGGAGGLLSGFLGVTPGSSITVTVGAGGVFSGGYVQGTNGNNSVFGSITTIGGGGGGSGRGGANNGTNGSVGGSGGGSTGNSDGARIGGAGIFGQGNNGGNSAGTTYPGQGGGGAGTQGLNNTSGADTGTNGGAGIASDISGSVVTYAGGGGGGGTGSIGGGFGGYGGGGGGGAATPGEVNTGGGGGGADNVSGALAGANGGSGIVIVRYPGTVQHFTGGIVSGSNGYVSHSFTSSGTLAPAAPTSLIPLNYLVVAGGGGGGLYQGAGAGGFRTANNFLVPRGVALTVTVGAGGAGIASASDPGNPNTNNGSDSVFSSIRSTGGGAAGDNARAGKSGGSGGGGGWNVRSFSGRGTPVQGNSGGKNFGSGGYGGGGGGGASTVGGNGTNTTGGSGGNGTASSITGSSVTYAGGGGGAGFVGGGFTTAGAGGTGGGGAGSASGSNAGANGTANTGGGAGASSWNGAFVTSSNGGSGVVVVSYPDTFAAPTATTGSPTVSTSGSGSIYNAGAGNVQFTGTATPFTFTGDFTIEGWYNLANFNNAAGGGNPAFVSSGGTGNWLVAIPGGSYVFYSGGNLILQTAVVASANVWNHFAIVRSGSTVTIYHNGSSVGTATLGTTVTGAATTTVTANSTGGVGSITGYMSNVRIVRGTAVYTGTFTPSTIPLTAITNTQLLMNAVSGGFLVDGSVNAFTPTSTSLDWNQLSPFTGTGYKNRVYRWTSSGSITL